MMTPGDVSYLRPMQTILKRLWGSTTELNKFLDKTNYYQNATQELVAQNIIKPGTELVVHADEWLPNKNKRFHLCIPTPRPPEDLTESEDELLMKLAAHILRSCADGC